MYPQSHEPACQRETVVGCPETLVAPQTFPEWPKGLGGQWCQKHLPGRWRQWTGLCSVLWPSPAIGAGQKSCRRWTDPSWSRTVTQEGSFLVMFLVRRTSMTLTNTFPATESRDMPRLFPQMYLSPFFLWMVTMCESSQVELYCHSATCGDIQWNEMSCLHRSTVLHKYRHTTMK